MPNHITSWVEITGSKIKIAKLQEAVVKPSEDEVLDNGSITFDFNGIIPMPDSMGIESSSKTDLGMAAFSQERFDKYKSYPWFASKYNGAKTPAELKKILEKDDKTALEYGEIAIKNLEKYGYKDWYDWSSAKWGTKWNAYDAKILYQSKTKLVVKFDTAWASPLPIFDELIKQGFKVNCKWVDEGGGDGEYGDPYSVFDIYQPDLEVEYTNED